MQSSTACVGVCATLLNKTRLIQLNAKTHTFVPAYEFVS